MNEPLARLLATLTHGVYVIGVADLSACTTQAGAQRRNAFTAAWLMQTSFDPPLLALSIHPMHSSYALLKAGRGFTVNVLARGRTDLAAHFGQPATADKLATVGWRPGRWGAPILNDALAWFECEVMGECPAGDHVVVIGRIVGGGGPRDDSPPMNYRETGNLDGSAALLPSTFPSAGETG